MGSLFGGLTNGTNGSSDGIFGSFLQSITGPLDSLGSVFGAPTLGNQITGVQPSVSPLILLGVGAVILYFVLR